MSSATVKVVGFDAILRKLDATIVEPEKEHILREAALQTMASLKPTLPRLTGASVARVRAAVNPNQAAVLLPRYPYIFLEAGSQYPHVLNAKGNRIHRRKTAAQWRAGTYRIRPRRFLRNERTKTRRRLVDLVQKMKQRIERRWSQTR